MSVKESTIKLESKTKQESETKQESKAKLQSKTRLKSKSNAESQLKEEPKCKEECNTCSSPWRAITLEELAKHTDIENNNAWMAVKGIVYNVSSYAEKHPGGADTIAKYAGKDATAVFNMIHAYVDAAAVLQGFQVAVLKGHPDLPKRGLMSTLKEKSWFIGCPYKPPCTYFKQDSIVGTYIVEFGNNSKEYEWTVGVIEKTTLHVYKCINTKKAWLSICELPEKLENDQLNINFRSNYKHIHITIRKPIPTNIWALQTHVLKNNGNFVPINVAYSRFDACVISKKCLSPNMLMFAIQIVNSARIGVPIGLHVELHKGDIGRPYTPVSSMLMDQNPGLHSAKAREKKQMEDMPPTVLYFMIKIYPNGKFTQILDSLPLDDGKETPTLQVSTPHGYFDLNFIHDFTALFLISGGSGIAPMIRILQWFWYQNERLRGKRIAFWHFVHKEHDLVWKNFMMEMDDATTWFHYFPVLTQANPNSNWQGLQGRVTENLINSCISDIGLEKRGVRKACVCGPSGFNSATVSALAGTILSENIFVFSN